jgi:hypothetical protein
VLRILFLVRFPPLYLFPNLHYPFFSPLCPFPSSLHMVTNSTEVIRKHTSTSLPTWFGNLTSAYGRSRHHGATKPPYRGDDDSYHPPPQYGNGEVIEEKDLELALDIAESMQVDVVWEEGDVVLLDVSLSMMKTEHLLTAYRIMQSCIREDHGLGRGRCLRRFGMRGAGLRTLRRGRRSWLVEIVRMRHHNQLHTERASVAN